MKRWKLPILFFLTALPASARPEGALDKLVIGTIGGDFKEAVEELSPLSKYLGDRLGPLGVAETSVKVAGTVEEMARLLRDREVDLYIGGPFPSRLVARASGAQRVLRAVHEGRDASRSVIVVRKDSHIRGLNDLPGKEIAFDHPYSSFGFYVPKGMLAGHGLRVKELVRAAERPAANVVGYRFARHDQNTAVWVAVAKTQAGAMSEDSFEGLPAERKENLRVLARSPEFSRRFVSCRRDLDPRLLKEIKAALLTMAGSGPGRAALESLRKTSGFEEFPKNSDPYGRVDEWLGMADSGHRNPRSARNARSALILGQVSSDPERHYRQLKPLADYVAERMRDLGVEEGSVRLAKDNGEMAALLKSGEVDWVGETPFSAVLYEREAGSQMILLSWKDGVPSYNCVFITRKDSPIRSLTDLKGKKIAFVDAGSSMGYHVPGLILKRLGIRTVPLDNPRDEPPKDAAGTVFSGSGINTTTWVFKGLVDVGVYSNIDWENPEEAPPAMSRELRILHETRPFPRSVEIVRPGLDPAVKNKLVSILLKAGKDPQAKAALEAYDRTAKFERMDGLVLENMKEVRWLLR